MDKKKKIHRRHERTNIHNQKCFFVNKIKRIYDLPSKTGTARTSRNQSTTDRHVRLVDAELTSRVQNVRHWTDVVYVFVLSDVAIRSIELAGTRGNSALTFSEARVFRRFGNELSQPCRRMNVTGEGGNIGNRTIELYTWRRGGRLREN